MEKLNKLTAPASEKLRQLQKMVEGIKKNDGSIMDRLKRLKKKPPPKLPTRDYHADEQEDDEGWSGSEFDSDTYEDPLEDHDDNYEPPPSEQVKRVFTPAPSASFPRGEYVDSLRNRPSQPAGHPAHSPRDRIPLLPPKYVRPEDDSEDYIDPEEGEDDNYIDPSENTATDPPSVNRNVNPARTHPLVSNSKLDSTDKHDVQDLKEQSPPVSRSSAHPRLPGTSPRLHAKKPPPATEPVEDDDEEEYAVCDPDESESMQSEESCTSSSLTVPTPRLRALNKPIVPVKPNALPPKREHDARPMAMKHNMQSARPLPSDATRARSPHRQQTSPPCQQTHPPQQQSSPPRQRSSLPRQRTSPPREQTSPPRQRCSPPRQRCSPPRQRCSSPRRQTSPPRQRSPPPRQRCSPPRQRSSPLRQRTAPPWQRTSPSRQWAAPSRKRTSPSWQQTSTLLQRNSPPPQRTSSPTPPTDRGNSPRTRKGSSTVEEEANVHKKAWYTSTCDRRSAEEALRRSSKEGAYLVRKSSGQDPSQPYTLVVFYNSRIYNIPIRHIPTTHQYALGREKTGEEHFSSVSGMIEHYQRKALVLIDSQSKTKDSTRLLFATKP